MAETEHIRVLVADDQAVFRRGLHVVLDDEDDIEVVAEASDGEQAAALASELRPDVVLMDVRMPRVSGIEASRRITAAVPSAQILMLTVSDEEEDLFEAIKAGANGYLLKEVSIEEVPEAIRAVTRGESSISPHMAAKLASEFRILSDRSTTREEPPPPSLTTRELEVLKLVARGMSNREVGEALFISENTVKNHVRSILEKLHLHTRMEAAMYAVRQRIVDPHVVDH
jgi:two-component system NarL family response regulator